MNTKHDTFSVPETTTQYLKRLLDNLDADHTPVWDRFGADFANGIQGWIFSDEEVLNAGKNRQLMHMDYEFGHACSLNCVYCFRTDDERDGGQRMDYEAWEETIVQAKELGLKSVKMLGQGELTENKRFMWAMETLAKHKVQTLLFTAGHVIGDDHLCQRIHGMSGRQLADRLYDLGLSIMVKVNSFDPEVQDAIVGREGFAAKRDRALQRLLDAGFANSNPTRLGLEVAMMNTDLVELEEIYNLKFQLNLYIDLDPFMPCGLTKQPEALDFELGMDEKIELYKRVYARNIRHGVPFRGISPYAGGQVCSQLGYGLFVNIHGHVYACPGAKELLGKVTDEPLAAIFERAISRKQFAGNLDHGCPFREAGGVLYKGWEDDVRKGLAHIPRDEQLFRLDIS